MNIALIQKAKAGDSAAFSELVESLRPLVLSYLYRRLSSREEAEDLCQEVLMAAFTGISSYEERHSFQHWLFQLASRLADPLTEAKQPWGIDALEVMQGYLLAHESAQHDLQHTLEDYEEEYHVSDHVDFCFTVLGRSLFPREENILLLRRGYGFKPEEVSDIVGAEVPEVEAKLSDAEETLREIFAKRCSLIKTGAPCTQCRDYGEWLGEDGKIEEELQELPLQPTPKADATMVDRLEVVKSTDPLHSDSARFHDALMALLRRALGEKGVV